MAEQIIAVIGAGGKTTAMGVLAGQAPPGAVLLTTTTHILPVSGGVCLTDPKGWELVQALRKGNTVCAGSAAQEGKLKMLPPSVLSAGIRAAKTVIYEGDGSKRLPLKLHRPGEPVLLPGTTAVLVVAGLSALGKPVGETIHRYDRHPGWNPAQVIGPEEFLYCIQETVHSAGGSRERIRIYLNQADTCQDSSVAEALCGQLHQQGLTARFGSLRQNPQGFYDWVISKET